MNNPIIEKYGHEKRWVNYKMIEREGKTTKIPYAVDGKLASSTDPLTWSTYNDVFGVSHNVGVIFTHDQMLLGIDIDHCLNKQTGEIDHIEKETITAFILEADSYTEISPSQTGLHIFIALTDALKLDSHRSAPFECYTSGRYFTFTGQVYGAPKNLRTMTPDQATSLLALIGYPWNRNDITPKTKKIITEGDASVLEKMFSSKNGYRIRILYDGDISNYDNDDSRADMALCMHLAFWTSKNVEQMERIWLNSPLGSRKKTQERKDYRDRTIASAIKNCSEEYKGVGYVEDEFIDEIIPYEKLKQAYKSNNIDAGYRIAQTLIKKYSVKTIGEKKSEIYVYKDGIYVLGESFLNAEIQSILEELTSIRCKNEIISKIKDLTITDRQEFSKVDRNLINLNNGILNIQTLELLPHTPIYPFFTKFPVSYQPNIDCPKIKKFLSETLSEKDTPIVQEWIGYCLYRKYFIKKAIIFVGEPNTGKTTLLNLICKLIGSENTCGVNLQKISSDKFSVAHFYNKHLNSYDDLSFKDVNDNGAFKIATGGGLITGERKFGNQFQFENYAKITFCCNKIPNVKDTNDDAYFSRWIIIPFNKQVATIDRFLIDQMTDDNEMSGLLNFALEGLNRLLIKHDFSYDKTVDDIKDEMLRSGSPIANFVYDCLEESPNSWVSKEEMYNEYAQFVKSKDLILINIIDFGRKITKYANYMIGGRHADGKTGWRNVRFKNREENLLLMT